jgi:hypothetical protein
MMDDSENQMAGNALKDLTGVGAGPRSEFLSYEAAVVEVFTKLYDALKTEADPKVRKMLTSAKDDFLEDVLEQLVTLDRNGRVSQN